MKQTDKPSVDEKIDDAFRQYEEYEVLEGDNPVNHAHNNYLRFKAAIKALINEAKVEEINRVHTYLDSKNTPNVEMEENRLSVVRTHLWERLSKLKGKK